MYLSLRRATSEDCNLLFKWVNDEEVRKNSFNSDRIKFEDHLRWYENKISSDNCHIFICCNEQVPIGKIRIDISGYEGIIDYSIDNIYRGQGYGTKILILIEKEVSAQNMQINKLIGQVKYFNIASQKAFEKNRYEKIEKKDYIQYTKIL